MHGQVMAEFSRLAVAGRRALGAPFADGCDQLG